MSPKRGNVTFASGFNLSNNTGRNCKYRPAVRESVFDSEKTRPNARCKANKQSWTVPIGVTIQVVVYSHWRWQGGGRGAAASRNTFQRSGCSCTRGLHEQRPNGLRAICWRVHSERRTISPRPETNYSKSQSRIELTNGWQLWTTVVWPVIRNVRTSWPRSYLSLNVVVVVFGLSSTLEWILFGISSGRPFVARIGPFPYLGNFELPVLPEL